MGLGRLGDRREDEGEVEVMDSETNTHVVTASPEMKRII